MAGYDRALDGLKILDFGWLFTVPIAGKYFAEHGAAVIKIESNHRIDPIRTFLPMAENINGINRSLQFAEWNDSKYGMALNLKKPAAVEVALRLAAWSDVVIENYTPGSMERMGLGYEGLRAVNPDVIMVRASLEGQKGPSANRSAMGIVLQSLVGLVYHVGWPDRTPVQIPLALTDFTAASWVMLSVMAALDYRRRTGKGMCLDLSQHETGEIFLAPDILNYAVHGRIKERQGNRSSFAAPHGIYRCRGEDRWCAVSVCSDSEWCAFCNAVGRPDLASDPDFCTLEARKRNEDRLDHLVEGWTSGHTAEDVMRILQAGGVSAAVTASCRDLNEDPQMVCRGHYQPTVHPEIGEVMVDTPPYRLSETPARVTSHAPCLGEHTEFICRQILGMGEEEFVSLYGEEVFE